MISPQIKFKKKWLDNKGVSEVIGTILMLAITVVLFSSIMVFVTNMPTPIDRPTADFLSDLSIAGGSGTVTLTHNGGEALNDYETQILVIKDNVVLSTPRTMAAGGLGSTWKIGQKWTANITPLTATNNLEVMIVDTHSNSQIWSGKIGTGVGNNFPAILQRWVDSDTTTITPDPIRASQTKGFSLYVRVTDVDKDLLYVRVDSSSIGDSSNKSAYASVSNVWEFRFNSTTTASAYDGKPLFIKARDTQGHQSIETFILSVLQPDITINENNFNNTTQSGGTPPDSYSGTPAYVKFQNSGHAYVVLGENKSARPPDGNAADHNNATMNFVQDDWVFIHVASMSLNNLLGKNSLTVRNSLTGEIYSPPSSASAFYKIANIGDGALYETKFNSSVLNPGSYQVTMDLLSTSSDGKPPVRFYATTSIIIVPKGGTAEWFFTPTITMYDKNRRVDPSAKPWGNTSDEPFDTSDLNLCRVWVEVRVQDIDALSSVYIDNVEITDYRSRTNLYGSPPTGDTMMSSVSSDSNNKTYYFCIDLRLKNGNPFAQGLASYSLSVIKLLDADEGLYTVIVPIWIKGTTEYYDFIVMTDGFQKDKNPNAQYAFQIDNNRFFTTRIIDDAEEEAGSVGASRVYLSEYFDIDKDGDRDVLAALYVGEDKKKKNLLTGHHVVMYFNQLEEYGMWSDPIELENYTDIKKALLSFAFGDVDNDGDMDWISANANGNVTLYVNDWPIVTKKLFTTGATAKYFLKMKLVDINGDRRADLVGMGGTDDEVMVGDAGCMLYFYNLTRGGSLITCTGASTPVDFNTGMQGNNNLMDFSLADIDKDGDIDVAVCADTLSSGSGIRWHKNNPTYTAPALAIADPATYVGNRISGNYVSTHTSDDSYEAIREDSGDLEYIWSVGPVAGTNPMLYFEGKISSGADEGFYVFYRQTLTGPWIFVAYMSNTVDRTFTYPLMPGTTGTIQVKVIDASSAGTVDDTIYIDRISVLGILSISYANTQGLSADTDYNAIDIGDMDNTGNLDVAVGKQCVLSADKKSISGGKLKVISGAGTALTTISYYNAYPTRFTFLVRDVNGDGRADIITVLMTGPIVVKENDPANKWLWPITILQEWLNLGSGTSFYSIEVKDLTLTFGAKGGQKDKAQMINSVNVEKPFF